MADRVGGNMTTDYGQNTNKQTQRSKKEMGTLIAETP
jgi:hypothetical protein